jgi:hypothetical protein
MEARMSKWLVHCDGEEAVFRKPLVDCLGYGAFALGSAYVFVAYFAPLHSGKPADREMFVLASFYFALILLVFSFGAGPKEMRFDFRARRYHNRMGFPFLTWTRAGDFSEISHLGVWNLTKFTGLSVEWKDPKRLQTTFVACSTGREAQALGESLGGKIGVRTEAGVVRGLKKRAK